LLLEKKGRDRESVKKSIDKEREEHIGWKAPSKNRNNTDLRHLLTEETTRTHLLPITD
jgi:hypothetical protein